MVMVNDGVFHVSFTYADTRPFNPIFSYSLTSIFLEAVLDGVDQLGGGYSRDSAVAFVGSVKRFLQFLEAHPHMLKGCALVPDAMVAYRKWLAQDLSIAGSTKNTVMNCSIRLVKWLMRNRPSIATADFDIRVQRFGLDDPIRAKASLTEDEVKMVLRACQDEIDFYWEKFSVGRRLLAGGAQNLNEEELAIVLTALLECGGGIFPTQAVFSESIKAVPNLMRKIAAHGGFGALKEYCFLTSRSVVPFYISVVAQTAGNSDAIMAMSRNSIVEHEIFATSKLVTWEKGRGLRDQRREFDARKRYSAPNLIGNIVAMTESLARCAPMIHRNKLFLHQGMATPSVISRQHLHNRLAEFITKHQLVNFDPSDLRPTSAELHDQVGGIIVAQKVLNHVNVETTQRYVDGNRKRQEFDKLIYKFQGQLLTKVSGSDPKTTPTHIGQLARQASTTFGFDCSDPLAGTAPGTVRGKLCDKFQMCATCPGAIIVLDDVNVAARLLQAMLHLVYFGGLAQQQGWGERFVAMYQPTLTILISITEKLTASVRRQAELVLQEIPPLPDLE